MLVDMDQQNLAGGFRFPVRSAFGGFDPAASPQSPQVPGAELNSEVPVVQPAIQQPEIAAEVVVPTPVTPVIEEPMVQAQQSEPVVPSAPPSEESEDEEYFPLQGGNQEEVLYEWKAPSRPFKKRKRQYFMTVITIGVLLSLILFFAGQILPIAVVFAVVFLSYVMATVPPHDIMFGITTLGIRIEDELYYWEELGRFWYSDIYTQRVLHVELDRFPFRLSMVLGADAQEAVLSEYLMVMLLHEQPKPTTYEKISDWLQKKFPLDLDS